jgi:hypothetical protein
MLANSEFEGLRHPVEMQKSLAFLRVIIVNARLYILQ